MVSACKLCSQAERLDLEIKGLRERLNSTVKERTRVLKPHPKCKVCGVFLESDHWGGSGDLVKNFGIVCKFCFKDYRQLGLKSLRKVK